MKRTHLLGIGVIAFVLVGLFLFLRSPDSPEESVIIVEDLKVVESVKETAEPQSSPEDIWSHRIWLGDYSEMVERRLIRVLIPPGKTFFFLDKGRKRGLTYDNMMAFEKYINGRLKSRHMMVKVVVIPTSRKNLLSHLQKGYGDIAAGNLTITAKRQELVDFTDPLLRGVEEIIVSALGSPVLKSLFDLAGREVYVRVSSSYYESLLRLNNTL